jgi:hypothetical protein
MTSTWRFALFGVLLTLTPLTVQARTEFLPVGTRLRIQTTRPIDASSARRGMRVDGTVYRPMLSPTARIVVPRGSLATLEITDVRRSSNLDVITLAVRSVNVGNRRYRVFTNEIELSGPSGARATAGTIGGAGLIGGTGIGTARGGHAADDTVAIIAGSDSTHVTVPEGTRLQFRLDVSTRIPAVARQR